MATESPTLGHRIATERTHQPTLTITDAGMISVEERGIGPDPSTGWRLTVCRQLPTVFHGTTIPIRGKTSIMQELLDWSWVRIAKFREPFAPGMNAPRGPMPFGPAICGAGGAAHSGASVNDDGMRDIEAELKRSRRLGLRPGRADCRAAQDRLTASFAYFCRLPPRSSGRGDSPPHRRAFLPMAPSLPVGRAVSTPPSPC